MDTKARMPPSHLNGNSSAATSHQPLVKVQPPRLEDLQPSYAQTLESGQDASNHGWYGSMVDSIGNVIGLCGAVPCCIFCPNPYKKVHQGNVGLITKFGRFSRAIDPGLVKVNPLSENLIQVDVRIQIAGKGIRHLRGWQLTCLQRFLNKCA